MRRHQAHQNQLRAVVNGFAEYKNTGEENT